MHARIQFSTAAAASVARRSSSLRRLLVACEPQLPLARTRVTANHNESARHRKYAQWESPTESQADITSEHRQAASPLGCSLRPHEGAKRVVSRGRRFRGNSDGQIVRPGGVADPALRPVVTDTSPSKGPRGTRARRCDFARFSAISAEDRRCTAVLASPLGTLARPFPPRPQGGPSRPVTSLAANGQGLNQAALAAGVEGAGFTRIAGWTVRT